jgi:hypothetical protein
LFTVLDSAVIQGGAVPLSTHDYLNRWSGYSIPDKADKSFQTTSLFGPIPDRERYHAYADTSTDEYTDTGADQYANADRDTDALGYADTAGSEFGAGQGPGVEPVSLAPRRHLG